MFERLKCLRRRSQGMYGIMMGMDVQIRHFEMRLNSGHGDPREVDAILRTLRYWRKRVQEVYDGEEI